MFGSDSYALMGRKPELTFSNIYRMLGRTADHPVMQEFKTQYFPHQIYTNETTGATSLKLEDTQYTPEELMALILQHIKDMSEAHGGKAIKDCVITVPSSFTQHEREAVYTAADIAELKVLSLIEENTAAALHYSLDRTFDTPTNVMFFNMGAGATEVSVATFFSQTVKEGSKNKTVGSFDIVGKAWDSSLGGFNFDVRLAEMLADRFNEAWHKKASGKGKDLRDFTMPMTKLRIQANKVKEILSANVEFPVKAESLHADVDLNTKVTRAEFEAACEDLFARITLPIDQALARANLKLEDIHSVELLGGGVRMPRVKKVLDEYFASTKTEVGQHLNGDEAMAMGAAFKAANLSTAFRVRKVGANDISSFGVSVRLNTLPTEAASGGLFGNLFGSSKPATPAVTEGSEETVWSKFTSLYPSGSAVPSKTKTVAFTYDQDISCRIEYDENQVYTLPMGADPLIGMYNITGVAAFAKEHESKNLGTPKVHLSFGLDTSGLVTLVKAEVSLEIPEEKPAETDAAAEATAAAENATEEAAGADAASTATTEDAEKKDETKSDDANKTEKAEKKDSKKKDTKSKKATKGKEKDRFIRKVLKVENNLSATRPPKWTPAQIAEAKTRRLALKAADDLKKATEAALNDLEGYIYKVKNNIEDQEKALKAVSTDEQRQAVVDLASSTMDWMEDEGRDQTIAVYAARQKDIQALAEPIFKRLSELKARPEAVAKARKSLKAVAAKVESWAEKLPHITEEEKEKVMAAVTKAEAWIDEKVRFVYFSF